MDCNRIIEISRVPLQISDEIVQPWKDFMKELGGYGSRDVRWPYKNDEDKLESTKMNRIQKCTYIQDRVKETEKFQLLFIESKMRDLVFGILSQKVDDRTNLNRNPDGLGERGPAGDHRMGKDLWRNLLPNAVLFEGTLVGRAIMSAADDEHNPLDSEARSL